MKSAQINRYWGSEVIEINQNTPEPTLSSGKVLVSIKSAGVNPADWKIREGAFQRMIDLQFPFTLGMDFSGIIKQVGEGVSNSDFKQGDEVYGQAGVINEGSGAFVEMALAKTESVANKPKRLSHVEAAALPIAIIYVWFFDIWLIIKVAGTRDQKGYLWNGYKGYIGINGGKNGIGIEFGRGPNYQDFTDTKVTTRANLQPGHTYTLRATRENLGNSVRVTIYAQEEGGPE